MILSYRSSSSDLECRYVGVLLLGKAISISHDPLALFPGDPVCYHCSHLEFNLELYHRLAQGLTCVVRLVAPKEITGY